MLGLTLRAAALLVLVSPLSACLTPSGSAAGPATPTSAAASDPDLDAARQRWQAAGLTSYTMTLERACFCPEDYRGPFTVTVRDGAVRRVAMAGQALSTDRALSVDALFDVLAKAYAEGAADVRVSYDPTLGYPTSLYIDFDARMADEEVGYTVSAFSRT